MTSLDVEPDTRSHSLGGDEEVAVGEGERTKLLDLVAPVVIVLGLTAFVTYVFAPGYMNADTLVQFDQAVGSAPITDWHAPVFVMLWGVLDGLSVGPSAVLAGQTLVLACGIYLVLRTAARGAVAAFVTAGVLLSPPVLSQVQLLGRDTWMVATAMLAFAAAIRIGPRPRGGRIAWAALTVVATGLTFAARQNSIPLVLAIVAVAARQLTRDVEWSRARRHTVIAAAACAGVVVCFLATELLYVAAGVDKSASPESALFAYDVAALSIEEDEVLFDPSVFPSQNLDEIRARFDGENIVPLMIDPGGAPGVLVLADPRAQLAVRDDWIDAVTGDPLGYLSERADLFALQIGLTGPPQYPMHLGVDGNRWGFELAHPEANERARDYVGFFAEDDDLSRGGHLFRPVYYIAALCAALGAVVLLLRRHQLADTGIDIVMLGAGALLYEATFFFLAMGVGYRWSYPFIVIVLTVVGWTLLAAYDARTRRRASATTI